MTANFAHKSVNITAFADAIDLLPVVAKFNKHYIVQKYKDALHINLPKGEIFVFNYGVMVSWGVSLQKSDQYLGDLCQLSQLTHQIHKDSYQFGKLNVLQTIGSEDLAHIADRHQAEEAPLNNTSVLKHQSVISDDGTSDIEFTTDLGTTNISNNGNNNEKICLPDYSIFTLLAVSHALAQSLKLETLEARADNSIRQNRYITDALANSGKIPLKRKQLARLRGQLFQTKNDILLHYSLLDKPEFFWDNPNVEQHYTSIANYLELTPRTELLNLKLQVIQDLFEMLAGEQYHKHYVFLEWIMIILIVLGITVGALAYFN